MAQPTEELIIWANTDVNLPELAGPNKTKPIDDLINKGWDFTEKPAADEFNYILNNIGQWINWAVTDLETGTPSNTPNTLVKRDSNGDFSAGTVTADLSGNASTASKWQTARNLAFTGFATGNGNVDGSGNVSIALSMGNGFTNSKAVNGYTYLPNGFIFQWGYLAAAAAGGNFSTTFPITFPTAALQVNSTLVGVGEGTITYVKTTTITASGATFYLDADNGSGINWFAIGY